MLKGQEMQGRTVLGLSHPTPVQKLRKPAAAAKHPEKTCFLWWRNPNEHLPCPRRHRELLCLRSKKRALFLCVRFTYSPRKASGNYRQTKMKLSQSLCHVIVTYKVSNKGTPSAHRHFTISQPAAALTTGAVPKLEGSFLLTPPHLSSEHNTAAAGSLREGANKRCTVAAEGTGSGSQRVQQQQQQQGGLFSLPPSARLPFGCTRSSASSTRAGSPHARSSPHGNEAESCARGQRAAAGTGARERWLRAVPAAPGAGAQAAARAKCRASGTRAAGWGGKERY